MPKMKVVKCKLKVLLPLVAFYYLTGPWRCLWVRFGYDPRADPHAKMYQTLDFRLRQSEYMYIYSYRALEVSVGALWI
jgi:hypothetical protein